MSKDRKKVRVALIGIGNCASSFIQGLQYYKDAPDDAEIPGLMHATVGGYHVRDIEISAAIDVVEGKVGKDVSEAIWAAPNNTIKFADVPYLNVPVSRGMTHDGLGKYVSTVVKKAPGPTDNIVKILKDTGTNVVINFMPVGSEMATKWYVEQALDAGCAFVNGIPVFIASSPYWSKRFEERGLPIVGDDIKSQVGATIMHRVLTSLFVDRGVRLDRTYQLNFGGNTDFMDTGATGGNGNYGGPCPPVGDKAHRYIFTLYALAVDKIEVAGGVPKTGTAGLYGFVLNKGVGPGLLGKASFTATYGR